jgi:hypothetical protein
VSAVDRPETCSIEAIERNARRPAVMPLQLCNPRVRNVNSWTAFISVFRRCCFRFESLTVAARTHRNVSFLRPSERNSCGSGSTKTIGHRRSSGLSRPESLAHCLQIVSHAAELSRNGKISPLFPCGIKNGRLCRLVVGARGYRSRGSSSFPIATRLRSSGSG